MYNDYITTDPDKIISAIDFDIKELIRASEELTKALLGETEQAKNLGITFDLNSVTFKSRIKEIQAMGVTEVQARAEAILEVAISQ